MLNIFFTGGVGGHSSPAPQGSYNSPRVRACSLNRRHYRRKPKNIENLNIALVTLVPPSDIVLSTMWAKILTWFCSLLWLALLHTCSWTRLTIAYHVRFRAAMMLQNRSVCEHTLAARLRRHLVHRLNAVAACVDVARVLPDRQVLRCLKFERSYLWSSRALNTVAPWKYFVTY